jgi:hypothetical protein
MIFEGRRRQRSLPNPCGGRTSERSEIDLICGRLATAEANLVSRPCCMNDLRR